MEKTLTVPVTGMTCANCAKTISRQAKKVEGVLRRCELCQRTLNV